MTVLGVNGSPHANGNTARALRMFLADIETAGVGTEYLSLADKNITPCNGCFACTKGPCVFDDDMMAIYDLMRGCDGLVLASPVYMGLVTGQMKVFMDRTVLLRVQDPFAMSGKVGTGIVTAGARNGGQELTLQCMHTYFLQQDMFAIADGPPASHSGGTIWRKPEDDEVGREILSNQARRLVRALGQVKR